MTDEQITSLRRQTETTAVPCVIDRRRLRRLLDERDALLKALRPVKLSGYLTTDEYAAACAAVDFAEERR